MTVDWIAKTLSMFAPRSIDWFCKVALMRFSLIVLKRRLRSRPLLRGKGGNDAFDRTWTIDGCYGNNRAVGGAEDLKV